MINDTLKRKLNEQKCPALIITRDSNERIENLARDCENLWLVCAPQNGAGEGTRIFNTCKGEVNLTNESLWDLRNFAEIILGG